MLYVPHLFCNPLRSGYGNETVRDSLRLLIVSLRSRVAVDTTPRLKCTPAVAAMCGAARQSDADAMPVLHFEWRGIPLLDELAAHMWASCET